MQLKMGTRNRKDSLHKGWREGKDKNAKVVLRSLKLKKNRKLRYEVPQDESQVSVGGFLALRYGSK
jgi:hypothetical protein